MANNCYFQARVTGITKKSIERFKNKMSKYRWGDGYEYDDILKYDDKNKTYTLDISGDCAWSISSSMVDFGLVKDTKENEVVFEAFSTESGIGFEEHLMVYKGTTVIDDCVDIEEYNIEDYENINELNKENGTNFTVEDLCKALVENDGWIKKGGLDNWGDFKTFTHEELVRW